MKSLFTSLLLAILCLNLVMCTHEPEPPIVPKIVPGIDTQIVTGNPCHPDTVYFANTILPLITSGCAMSGCHDQQSSQEGVILDSYKNIMKEVRAGNALKSSLYKQLRKSGEERMPPPPQDPFTADQQALIKTWIDQGAKNNSCTESDCDTALVTYSASVLPILKNNCLGCHNAGTASSSGGGIRLDTHADLKKQADNGQLYKSITHSAGVEPMPLGSSKPMDKCKIRKIKIWIDAGAPNN